MTNLLDMWRNDVHNPWREFASLQRQLDRLFSEFTRQRPAERSSTSFIPACDLDETEKHYLIALEIPGMTKDQLKVSITGNTLTVSGEKKEERKEGRIAEGSYERFYGRFQRSFTLPDLAASDKVEADYRDGVLKISIPKSEEAITKTRTIQIGEVKNPLFGKSQARSEEKKDQKSGERAA